MKRFSLTVAFVAMVVGGCLGVLFPTKITHASTSYSVYVYPGGNGYQSCGWHATCLSPYVSGAALDFEDPTWVYFRSYGSSSTGSVAGQGRIAYINSDQCHHLTYVDIYDVLGGYHAEVLYEHVSSGYAGYSFWINGGIPASTTEYYVGQTVQEPTAPTCPFTAKHVHEQTTGGGMSLNTTDYLDVAYCNASCHLLKGNWNYWVFSKLWVN
ncbi:MAG: hypothetical protein ABI577_00650 [bacterium]